SHFRLMKIDNFFAELKRRNVYKVAVAYAVAGWALAQGIAQVFPVFGVPNWIIQMIVLLIVIGFPIALVLAWVFELTPEGLKRTEDVDLSRPRLKSQAWIYVAVIGAVLSVGLFFVGRYTAVKANASENRFAKSIAVLPFESISDDKENSYFADGVQDQILTNLAKVSDLKVISHTSVRQYKTGAERNMRETGRQLGGGYLVEGSAEPARANDLLFCFDLDPAPERITLAETAVNTALRLRPDLAEAHFARADFLFRCRRDYDRALEELAIARPGLPNSTPFFILSGYINRRRNHFPEAERDFSTAFALDPRNPNAYNLLADTYVLQRRFPEAVHIYDNVLAAGEQVPIVRARRASCMLWGTGDSGPL